MTQIRKLAHNVYTLNTGNVGAFVTFGNADIAYSPNANNTPNTGSRGDHVQWGDKDRQLANMHRLACESPNKWRLIKTRRDFVVGRGVYTHTEETAGVGSPTYFKPAIFPEFEQWRRLNDWDRAWIRICFQYGFSGNVFVKLVFGTDGKLGPVDAIDAFKIRPRKLARGETCTTAYLVNPNQFGSKAFKKEETEVVPAFDPQNPAKYPVAILHLKDDIPGQDNFGFPEWWSTEEWSKVANKIPKFHDAGLDNGYNIKYHISIPDDYFLVEGKDEQEQEALKAATLRKMGETLAGVENTDKALITFHKADVNGKEIPGVRITPLDNKMSDDAYTNLFNTANVAQASGHGVLPSLAGIDTGSKMGGSGKELEAAANYQQNFLTYVDRFILLTPLRIAQAVNGWPWEMMFDVRNIQLYNYDVTPKNSGSNPSTETDKDDANQ
ncbi:hypothetical protein LX87_04094 [Larkinella arboricola]|uniref:Phage portal protein n=1 Tax=Larkinella arboricola TaxID=643671 RepID=A0A327WQG9_LARAB|nr:hypothetical protein [Larkinella arboricola]RAJ94209.1 hypothetical protein LX87_04094 [Larkinella arboricola]